MKATLQFGPFRLDSSAKRLYRGAEEVALPPKALDVLEFLAQHAGALKTRDELFAALWPGTTVDDHALSVQIREIRRALGDNAHNPTYIETRHRMGYCFRAQVTRVFPAAVAQTEHPATFGLVDEVHRTQTGAPLHPPPTRYARSGNVNIAYQVIGDGPIDLVFVMGWISHLEYFWTEPRFARFLQRLASFSRVILFDKRGTGLSDRVPLDQLPTLEQRMEDLHAVMQATGSERAVICGVSEGGCMSAVFAATYPERTVALVMIAAYARRLRGPGYPWGPDQQARDAFLREIEEHWGGPVGLEERAPSVAGDPHFRRWWATYLRMGASPSAAVAFTRMNTEVDIRRILPAVRVPSLVIHRTGDLCLKVEEGRYIASLIPGAKFVELPGPDHLPFVGDQDAILDAIQKFVDDVEHNAPHESSLATILAVDFGGSEVVPQIPAGFEAQVDRCIRNFHPTLSRYRRDLLAAFDGPARAVRAAKALLTLASQSGVPATAGVHTGECVIISGRDIGGNAVALTLRIRSTAAPGEVLVSGTLRDLVAGSGLEFEPRGHLIAGELGRCELLRLKT